MPKQLLVKGHTLPYEGRFRRYLGNRTWNGPGVSYCSCGALSEVEHANASQTKRWHREHKLAVIESERSTSDG